jgi:hypothetical protein
MLPICKEKIQLSGYSAYPEGSPPQVIRISGGVLHVLKQRIIRSYFNCELSLLIVSGIYETFCIVMRQITLRKTNTFQIIQHLRCSQRGC